MDIRAFASRPRSVANGQLCARTQCHCVSVIGLHGYPWEGGNAINMNKYLSLAIAGLFGIIMVSGCSPMSVTATNSFASNVPLQTESNVTFPTSSLNWKSTGENSFLLQGKIVGINDKAPYLLTVKLEQAIVQGAVVSQPKFPESAGSPVTIQFKEPFAKQGSMEPKKGEEVILGVKQYNIGTNTAPFWGSDASQYYYKKNGKFYGETGLQFGMVT